MYEHGLKEKLINKIRETNDLSILEEVSNLFELHEPEAAYRLGEAQRKEIAAGREDDSNRKILTDEEADKETDE